MKMKNGNGVYSLKRNGMRVYDGPIKGRHYVGPYASVGFRPCRRNGVIVGRLSAVNRSQVCANTVIGDNCKINDSKIAEGVIAGHHVTVSHSSVGNMSTIGPYSCLRRCRIGSGVSIGHHVRMDSVHVDDRFSVPPYFEFDPRWDKTLADIDGIAVIKRMAVLGFRSSVLGECPTTCRPSMPPDVVAVGALMEVRGAETAGHEGADRRRGDKYILAATLVRTHDGTDPPPNWGFHYAYKYSFAVAAKEVDGLTSEDNIDKYEKAFLEGLAPEKLERFHSAVYLRICSALGVKRA